MGTRQRGHGGRRIDLVRQLNRVNLECVKFVLFLKKKKKGFDLRMPVYEGSTKVSTLCSSQC